MSSVARPEARHTARATAEHGSPIAFGAGAVRVRPARSTEIKRTRPSTQAAHWFGMAVLHVLRDLGRHPDDLVAIGLADAPRYRAPLVDTERALRQIQVAIFLVHEDGSVEVRLPLADRAGTNLA
jgi:hypothetical protein